MDQAQHSPHSASPPRRGGAALFVSLCMAAMLLAMPGLAAADNRLPGVVDRPPEAPPALERGAPSELPATPQPVPPRGDDTAQALATFSAVTFTGTSVISQAALSQVAAPYLHRPLSSTDLAQLKFDITRLYFERGYVLVKVTTPPQDIGDGILDIVIHEARIGHLQVEHAGHLRQHIATALARRLKANAVFHEGDIESLANDYNDLGGLRAALTLHKGTAPGTTDLILKLSEEDEDIQHLTLDNYGSDLTGEWVGALRLQASNHLRLGETVGLHLRASNDALWSVGMDASAPLGMDNLRLQFDYSHSENEIGDRLAFLDASGTTDRARLTLASAWLNTRAHKLTVRTGLDARVHESELAGARESRDHIRQWLVEGSYLSRRSDRMVYAALTLSKGLDMLGASDEGDALASRNAGVPTAWRLQPLVYGLYKLHGGGQLKAIISGQLASHTLLSSDLFALGGYGSVRGFQPAETTGEAGVQYSLEYARHLGEWQRTHWTVGLFGDGGRVWNREDDSVADDALHSAGLSLEAQYRAGTRYGTTLRLDAAAPLGDYESQTVDDYQILVRITQTF